MARAKAKIAARRAGRVGGSGGGSGGGDALPHPDRAGSRRCWLCERPLGRRVEWHHPRPRSRGGRETVPVHPICHRTIHALFSNADLAGMQAAGAPLTEAPAMARFLRWIAGKPPDFHAPTRRPR